MAVPDNPAVSVRYRLFLRTQCLRSCHLGAHLYRGCTVARHELFVLFQTQCRLVFPQVCRRQGHVRDGDHQSGRKRSASKMKSLRKSLPLHIFSTRDMRYYDFFFYQGICGIRDDSL